MNERRVWSLQLTDHQHQLYSDLLSLKPQHNITVLTSVLYTELDCSTRTVLTSVRYKLDLCIRTVLTSVQYKLDSCIRTLLISVLYTLNSSIRTVTKLFNTNWFAQDVPNVKIVQYELD